MQREESNGLALSNDSLDLRRDAFLRYIFAEHVIRLIASKTLSRAFQLSYVELHIGNLRKCRI